MKQKFQVFNEKKPLCMAAEKALTFWRAPKRWHGEVGMCSRAMNLPEMATKQALAQTLSCAKKTAVL